MSGIGTEPKARDLACALSNAGVLHRRANVFSV